MSHIRAALAGAALLIGSGSLALAQSNSTGVTAQPSQTPSQPGQAGPGGGSAASPSNGMRPTGQTPPAAINPPNSQTKNLTPDAPGSAH